MVLLEVTDNLCANCGRYTAAGGADLGHDVPTPNRYPRLFGKYALIAPIARGGMGELHLALSGRAQLRKICAIKQIITSQSDPEAITRFVDEARVMVKLSHGNLVPVFESGVIDGQYYLAMEYIEGKDLRALWNTLCETRRRCPLVVALHIVKEICRGLSYVHGFGDLGLVHRDISPPNVLLSYTGEVRLADFGLAYSRQKVQKTAPGVLFGKLSYMSPEQARCESVDARADIFSVGVILWELATGKRLFPRHGALRDQLERAYNPTVPLPTTVDPSLPPELDLITRRALEPRAEHRYGSAELLRREIAGLLARLDPTTDALALQRLLADLYGDAIAVEKHRREQLVQWVTPEIQRLQTSDSRQPPRDSAAEVGDQFEVLGEKPLDADLPSPTLKIGTVLGQRYRVDEVIGEGGMGIVYRAMHMGIDRQVAVKVLHPSYSWMPEVVARFQQEAKAASRIGHPNIVEIFDSGTTDDGCLYFAMEQLAGQDLADVLAAEGPLSVPRSISIATQICHALSAAHLAGIVHRDLKPENIFLEVKAQQMDFVKVVDFGIAQRIDLDQSKEDRLTQPGMAMGTPAYMAPEQAAGRSCDHRADIYAVGSILYEMLAGRPPHGGDDTIEVLNRKASDLVDPVSAGRPEVPQALVDAIQWTLEYRPEDRPQTMALLAYELTKISQGRPGAVASMLGLSPQGSSVHGALPASIATRRAPGDFTGPHPPITALLPAVRLSVLDRIPWTSVAVTAASAVILVSALMIWSSARQHEAPATTGPSTPTMPSTALQRAAPRHGDQKPAAGATGALRSDQHTGVQRHPSLQQPTRVRAASIPPDRATRTTRHKARRQLPRKQARRASSSARGMLTRGREHLRRGEFDRAREAFSTARRERRLRGPALVGLAQVEFQTGNLLAAEAYAKVAVNTSRSTAAHLMLGNLYFKRGDYTTAAKQYRAVIARRPHHAEAIRNLRLAEGKLGSTKTSSKQSSTETKDGVAKRER